MAEFSVTHEAVREAAHPLTGAANDFDPLLNRIGDCRFVLLGEASHGTHEFYDARATITKRLIREKGFNAIAVEADWPDAYRVNRYVRGLNDDPDAEAALGSFRRFPTWMWRNADVLDFVGWLRAENDRKGGSAVGFYGLDLYSLHTSMEEVLRYLSNVDPAAAERARQRYACFEQFGHDTHRYGFLAGLGLAPSCEREATAQLVELQERKASPFGDPRDEEERFYAEQNARLVKTAEEYYRTMFRGDVSSWNLRDCHMAKTLDEVVAHIERHDARRAKVVVWAHNSHVGDARKTERGTVGELNIGQLVRERYGADTVLVGFSTYEGTVTAASDWDGPAEHKRVRPALRKSYEALLHEAGSECSMLLFPPHAQVTSLLRHPRLERAIGVIYRPETERVSHYFEAQLSDQFDALIHFDRTRAVEPLERTSLWEKGEEETYPFAV